MTTAFPQPPVRQTMMDSSGNIRIEWVQWFSSVFTQIAAAAYQPSSVDITGGTLSGVTISTSIIETSSVAATTITASGTITGSNLSGTNTGDQTIALTGDVTGSGTGSFAATVAANAVTYAKMQAVSQAALLGATAAGAVTEITLGKGLSFISGALTAVDNTYDYTTPTTGFSYTIPNGVDQAILEPSGTLASGTITMPAAPTDGQRVGISSTQIITSLTVQANTGQTLKGGLSAATFAANNFASWMYRTATTTWYRVG